MAVACFSLIGIPLTVGFLGKVLLIKPALASHSYWLVILTVVNAAISAGYYLRIVGTMFLRDATTTSTTGVAAAATVAEEPHRRAVPVAITTAIGISVVATLLLGTVLPLTEVFTYRASIASHIDEPAAPAAAVVRTAAR
jgi:NADH:ubiquinone oxidoreductase subunit 2 (subunit N)